MATAPVKPQQLHNFPLSLKWGQTPSFTSSPSNPSHRLNLTPDSETESDPEPTATKSSRVGSRSARAHRFSFSILNNPSTKKPEEIEKQQKPVQHEEEDNFRPWKLRPRKETVNEQQKEKEKNTNNSSSHVFQPPPKSARLRGLAESSTAAAAGGGLGLSTTREREKEEKRKFWISLSREEIEEDIFILTGSRPSRRPKKRPKNQQKILDVVFPGLWLVGTTADSYRIADPPVKR